MALARLAMKNLHRAKVLSCPSSAGLFEVKRFMSSEGSDKVAGETSEGKEVATSTQHSKSLFSRKNRQRPRRSSRSHFFVPALSEFFPSGLGNALIQASETMNRLMEDLNVSPWSLSARVKEENDSYKLRFDVPGLRKEELKITVDDGVLIIDGEHSDGGASDSDDGDESTGSYGYYHSKLVLPKDAKADEIKATLKNGVLCVIVPKAEKAKKEIKEVQIQ